MTKFIKSSTNKDKEIIGQASNIIHHLNDLIHKLAFGGNNNLQETAFENAKNYFKVLNQNFISKIPHNESALIKRNEELEAMLKKVYNNMDDDNGWQEEQKNEITELLLTFGSTDKPQSELVNKQEEKTVETTNSMTDKKTALFDLKELLDSGILSKEEFEIEKQKILNA